MRKCPVTGEDMVHDTINGVEVDRSSAGVWLDKAELLEITQAERRKLTLLDEFWVVMKDCFTVEAGRPDDRGTGAQQRRLPCPVCGEAMFVDSYQDVHIDRCRAHGTWLDKGELELIVERLKDDPEFVRGLTVRIRDAQY
ncbi:MAG: zf-TFIIB domain-containing protein [Alphaproteobacteria bacterium]|nr:zf-TFIIB domain-containing protein [Alphaproteobacteria bacterium]